MIPRPLSNDQTTILTTMKQAWNGPWAQSSVRYHATTKLRRVGGMVGCLAVTLNYRSGSRRVFIEFLMRSSMCRLAALYDVGYRTCIDAQSAVDLLR